MSTQHEQIVEAFNAYIAENEKKKIVEKTFFRNLPLGINTIYIEDIKQKLTKHL